MQFVAEVMMHQAAKANDYKNIVELAKRDDLYTGQDFYFGFASNNKNYFTIITEKLPLAIKYGATISIYTTNIEDHGFTTYVINYKTKTLELLFAIKPVNTEDVADFQSLLPWSFNKIYDIGDMAIFKWQQQEKNIFHVIIENIAKFTINKSEIDKFQHELSNLSKKMSKVVFQQGQFNFSLLIPVPVETKPKLENFVAAYNPFYNNVNITFKFLLQQNYNMITIRNIINDDNYPRIEIILPNTTEHYLIIGVEDVKNYSALQNNLYDTKFLSEYLIKHYYALALTFLLNNASLSTDEKIKLMHLGQQDRLNVLKQIHQYTLINMFKKHTHFFTNQYHYDWWMFPMHVPKEWNWEPRNYDFSVNEIDVQILLHDTAFMQNYLTGITMYLHALRKYGWDDYLVRYARMLQSLSLFSHVCFNIKNLDNLQQKLYDIGQQAIIYAQEHILANNQNYPLFTHGFEMVKHELELFEKQKIPKNQSTM